MAAAASARSRIDGQGIQFSGIQILICGTKWDAIAAMDATSKEILAKALRCVAHAHGCHLVYHGGPAAPAGGATGRPAADQGCSKKLRHLLTHMMFIGLDKKLCVTHLLPGHCSSSDDRAGVVGCFPCCSNPPTVCVRLSYPQQQENQVYPVFGG